MSTGKSANFEKPKGFRAMLRRIGGVPDSVRQSEYGIAPVTAAVGAIRIKDEVKCTFDIVAREQE